MLYRFKSRATADTLMLDSVAEPLLTIMGKEITPKGVITVAQIPDAIAALHQAVIDSEARHPEGTDAPQNTDNDPDDAGPAIDPVRLRQRVAPLVTMLKESAEGGWDVVWGV